MACVDGSASVGAMGARLLRTARPSVGGWASGAVFLGVVAGLTAAVRAHDVSAAPFASDAARVAEGRLWLLISSALVVDRPVVIGLVTFAMIGSAALWICGARTFWITAVAGHVGSTLLVYAIIAVSRVAEPHLFSAAVVSPDFGVSAMQGAWVGALTATAWLRWRHDLRRRAAMTIGLFALAGVAWLLHPDPSILTTEHAFAFLIGVSIASYGRRLRSARKVDRADLVAA